MKKFISVVSVSIALFFSSCTNDDIIIDSAIAPVQEALTISVDLSKFYSGYTFDDTKHNIDQIAEAYRTFYSNSEMLIQVQTVIYEKNTGELADIITNYVTTTNAVTATADLKPGNYFAITSITFATKDKTSFWKLEDEEKLSTAKLSPRNRSTKWSILSQSTESFSVSRSQKARINTIPTPLGALVYFYYQNFQYENEASYGVLADNKVRRIALYSQRRADSYNLDPNATSKFNYAEETESGSWYFVELSEPGDYNESWTHFKSNLYDYAYILEPEQRNVFGIMREGDTSFSPYGEQTTTFTPGITYLAYWDYFQIGNPYLGPADNNHWHDYSQSTLYEEPYTTWGASLSTVKSYMSSKNYSLWDEGTNYLLYHGKYSENASEYDFDASGKLNSVFFYFNTDVSLNTISNYVANHFDVEFLGEEDGTIVYLTADNRTNVTIFEYTYEDDSKINIVKYGDISVLESPRAIPRCFNFSNQIKRDFSHTKINRKVMTD